MFTDSPRPTAIEDLDLPRRRFDDVDEMAGNGVVRSQGRDRSTRGIDEVSLASFFGELTITTSRLRAFGLKAGAAIVHRLVGPQHPHASYAVKAVLAGPRSRTRLFR